MTPDIDELEPRPPFRCGHERSPANSYTSTDWRGRITSTCRACAMAKKLTFKQRKAKALGAR